MATFGQIIFYSMVTLIVVFSALIVLILVLTFTKPSSGVMSANTAPVANLSQDELLSCFLRAPAGLTQVSVTWERKDLNALVYRFDRGAPDLVRQDPWYRDRTQLFPAELLSGNASLLLRNVRSGDEGPYTCTVSAPGAGGSVNIELRTAAFSTPTFDLSNGSLRASASPWLPKPSVTWADADGQPLDGTVSFRQNSAGTFSVVGALQPVNASGTYTCRLESSLVAAVSEATVTGSAVSASTYFVYSAAPPPPARLSVIAGVLCVSRLAQPNDSL